MFKSFSWQQFLTAALVVAGVYYAACIIFLYSKDIYRWLTRKSKQPEQNDTHLSDAPSNIMGGIKRDQPKEHEQSIDAQDLVVDQPISNQTENEDSLLIGAVHDLLHEIKVLARVIKESNGSKEEGAPMFQSLLSNYSHLIGTKYQESISLFIYEHCKTEAVFEVDLNEVKSWWPAMESQNNQ